MLYVLFFALSVALALKVSVPSASLGLKLLHHISKSASAKIIEVVACTNRNLRYLKLVSYTPILQKLHFRMRFNPSAWASPPHYASPPNVDSQVKHHTPRHRIQILRTKNCPDKEMCAESCTCYHDSEQTKRGKKRQPCEVTEEI